MRAGARKQLDIAKRAHAAIQRERDRRAAAITAARRLGVTWAEIVDEVQCAQRTAQLDVERFTDTTRFK